MKFKAILFFGLFCFVGFGQEISTELPVYSPQSPTTNDLGKYGEVQVNESTGVISPSIPLFEYNAGKMTIPLTLNYSGNGVRVNQDPTWVGVNWNINPGGVITRVVNDEPDETWNGLPRDDDHRLYLSESVLNGLPRLRELYPSSCNLKPGGEWFNTLSSMTYVGFDTEVDIFNYNFLGYSGSFYLDTENKVHLIKYDKELSITFIYASNNKSYFIIKTPNGDMFYFGGQNASESSRTWVNNGAASTVNVPYAQNAFYLYEISFLNGGNVTFEYDNFDITCDFYKVGIQENASVAIPLGNFPCNKTEKTLNCDVQNLVKLRKITNSFNSQEVIFTTSSYGVCDRMNKLNTIQLKKENNLIKKIELNYLTINNEIEEEASERKFFLTNVSFFNKNNVFEYDYDLTYKTPELFPSKKSFAQDHLGYYNGKNTNITLLPKSTNPLLNNNCFFGLANREADYNSSLIGSLDKIQYPTGGYTQFVYELPYKGQEDIIENHFMTAYFRDENRGFTSSDYLYSNNFHTYSMTYHPIGESHDGPLVLTSPKTVNVVLDVFAKAPFAHQSNVTLYVLKQTTSGFQVVDQLTKSLENDQNTIKNYYIQHDFNLLQGSYVFKLSVNLISADIADIHSVVAIAQLDLPVNTRAAYHPGLRIRRVISHDNNDSSNTTRYYYNNLNNLNTEIYQFHPNYTYLTVVPNPEGVDEPLIPLNNLSTNSVKNIFNTDSGNTYEYVTVSYGGENFENGGKQLTFEKYSNYPPEIYLTNPCFGAVPEQIDQASLVNYVNVGNNDSYRNSVLKEEKYINSNRKVLKNISYSYEGETVATIDNIKLFKYASSGSDEISKNVYFLYPTRSFKYRLKSTETKEYFGSNYSDDVTSNTIYQYTNDKVSLPSVIETTNSFGEIKRTNIYYPSDVASISNLSGTDISNLNSLTNKHNISQLVKTENLVNGQVLETKHVSFGNWGTNVFPKTIKISKGNGENDLEERVEFFNYYFGLPSLVSLKDGTRTKYEYNSNLQVVLKIENYDPNATIDPIEIPESDTNRPPNEGSCEYADLYPNSLVTKYDYDSITKNLIKVTDPKCNVTTYHYDEFGRLQQIRDHQGNILSVNEYHYKP